MVSTDVGVLDKVMAVLSLYDDRTKTLEPSAVAKLTEISTPTAYRLMKAMARHGLLTAAGRGYELGLSLLHLGGLAAQHLDIISIATPFMARLRAECNETVELQVRVGHTRVPVHLEVSTRTVRTQAQVGVPLPLHKGSSSRPLIAWLSEEEAVRLCRDSAEDCGEELDEGGLRIRLRKVRKQGYDVGSGERDLETAAAAAPIFDRLGGVTATLVVSATKTRFAEAAHRNETVKALVRAAADATKVMGGTAPA